RQLRADFPLRLGDDAHDVARAELPHLEVAPAVGQFVPEVVSRVLLRQGNVCLPREAENERYLLAVQVEAQLADRVENLERRLLGEQLLELVEDQHNDRLPLSQEFYRCANV